MVILRESTETKGHVVKKDDPVNLISLWICKNRSVDGLKIRINKKNGQFSAHMSNVIRMRCQTSKFVKRMRMAFQYPYSISMNGTPLDLDFYVDGTVV